MSTMTTAQARDGVLAELDRLGATDASSSSNATLRRDYRQRVAAVPPPAQPGRWRLSVESSPTSASLDVVASVVTFTLRKDDNTSLPSP